MENWLADLLKKSRRTVHSIICRAGSAIAEPNFNLLDFQSAFPAQVSTASELITSLSVWTLCYQRIVAWCAILVKSTCLKLC